jgi:uroporphyrinogen decarboxylase
MTSMTSKERLLTTLRLQTPDQIPTAFHNSAVVAEMSGVPYDQFFRSGKIMAETHAKAQNRFGYDGIIIDTGTHCSAETLGCGAAYTDKKYPVTTTPVLKRLDDIYDLKTPDPNVTFPACEMIQCVSLLHDHFGDEVALIATGDQGPFTLAALLLGMESWLMAVKENRQPELLRAVLSFALHYTVTYAIALYQAGADVVRFGDSFGGTQVVSPRMYSEWTFPYEKECIELLRPYNFPTSIHICGNATPILEGMVSTGASMIEVDELSDFQMTCTACAGKTALLGPISPSNMVFKTYKEIKQEARVAIEIARHAGTSLVLGAGCSMAGNTPFDNIAAVIDAAKEYGNYL